MARTPARKAGFSTAARSFPRETDCPLEGTGFEPSVPLLRKGLSAVAERRCRTDKLEGSLSTSRLARRAEGDPSRSTSLIFLNHHEHPSSSGVSAAACFVALWRGDWAAAENDAADCHRPDRQDDAAGNPGAGMLALYAARLSDLRLGDFLKVD